MKGFLIAVSLLCATSTQAGVYLELGLGKIGETDEWVATKKIGTVSLRYETEKEWSVLKMPTQGLAACTHISAYNNGHDWGHDYCIAGARIRLF